MQVFSNVCLLYTSHLEISPIKVNGNNTEKISVRPIKTMFTRWPYDRLYGNMCDDLIDFPIFRISNVYANAVNKPCLLYTSRCV